VRPNSNIVDWGTWGGRGQEVHKFGWARKQVINAKEIQKGHRVRKGKIEIEGRIPPWGQIVKVRANAVLSWGTRMIVQSKSRTAKRVWDYCKVEKH
jgi:hypothetical protein